MWFLLSVLVAATPAEPVKVAVPGLTAVGVDQALAAGLTERLVVLAKRPELSIVTSRDIAASLGIERQRQLLGCGSSECMAELADALGAEVILRGDLLKAGDSLTLVVKAIRQRDAKELFSDSVRALSLDGIQDWIEAHAARIGEEIVFQVRGRPARGGPGWLRFATLGVGVAAAAAGGVLVGLAYQSRGLLLAAEVPMTPEEIRATSGRGRAFEVAGYVCLAAAGALGALSAALFATYQPGTQLSVAVLPSGTSVAFTVALP